MLKFFSKRFRKGEPRPGSTNAPEHTARYNTHPAVFRSDGTTVGSADDKNLLSCHVVLLDSERVTYQVNKKALGSDLFEKVCFNLELNEKEYFGLNYTDRENIHHWLDPSKAIKKQVTISGRPMSKQGSKHAAGSPVLTLHLKVKFFPSQPNHVKEELTKYLLYLQLKEDIKSGELPLSPDLAVELSALTVQSELGDFEKVVSEDRQPGDTSFLPGARLESVGLSAQDELAALTRISEFMFLPKQSEDFELRVLNAWRSMPHTLNPAQCEDRYLNLVKDVEMYGVAMHDVYGKDGNTYRLGLTPFGMLIYDNDVRIGLFFWQKMDKLAFKHKKLIIEVVEADDAGVDQMHSFQFTMQSSKACKHLWKCAVEYHTFYRMQANSAYVRPRQSFVRMGSKFRYSGRTEAQLRATSRAAPQPRRPVQFERKLSKRYSRRESYRIRQKISQSHDDSGVRVTSQSTSQLSINVNSSSHLQITPNPSPRVISSSSRDNLDLIEFSPVSGISDQTLSPSSHQSVTLSPDRHSGVFVPSTSSPFRPPEAPQRGSSHSRVQISQSSSQFDRVHPSTHNNPHNTSLEGHMNGGPSHSPTTTAAAGSPPDGRYRSPSLPSPGANGPAPIPPRREAKVRPPKQMRVTEL